MNKMLIVFRKEWSENLKNKLLMYTVVLPPLLLAIIPLVMVYFIRNEQPSAKDMALYKGLMSSLPGLQVNEIFLYFMVSQFLMMFLIMPLIIPMTISAASIIGEKKQRSLEPLLATPITVNQLIVGKALAAVAPAMIVTWLAFGIFAGGAAALVSPALLRLLISPMWLLAILIWAPVLCVLAVVVGIIVSSKVTDERVAQQIGAMLVLPVVGLALFQTMGKVLYTTQTFAIGVLATLALDAVAIYLASKLFNREAILIRWK
jgi:ABC-2 type transport system permease protein